jgi:hypothetical protein
VQGGRVAGKGGEREGEGSREPWLCTFEICTFEIAKSVNVLLENIGFLTCFAQLCICGRRHCAQQDDGRRAKVLRSPRL